MVVMMVVVMVVGGGGGGGGGGGCGMGRGGMEWSEWGEMRHSSPSLGHLGISTMIVME